MRRYQRWPTREERDRTHDEIAAAGCASTWIRSGKPAPFEEAARKARLNMLAEEHGLSRPYPEVGPAPKSAS